jgi:pyruvyl transferase EpsO
MVTPFLHCSEQIDQTLREYISPGTRVALVDFPDYPNVGDNAIWVGTRYCLHRLQAEVVYTCSRQAYDRATLKEKLVEGGLIVISGGGN